MLQTISFSDVEPRADGALQILLFLRGEHADDALWYQLLDRELSPPAPPLLATGCEPRAEYGMVTLVVQEPTHVADAMAILSAAADRATSKIVALQARVPEAKHALDRWIAAR
jgi:hypothetical protein